MNITEVDTHSSEDGPDRPRQLIRAARTTFLAGGYDATSMESIARAAEVSKRTPYIYFRDKHDLFSAVVLTFLTEMDECLAPHWASEANARAALRKVAGLYADFALADPDRFELIMTFERRDFVPGKRTPDSPYANACLGVNDRITEKLTELIARGKKDGSLDTDQSPGQFGLLFWAAFAGVISIAVERDAVLEDAYGWHSADMIDAFIERFI